MSKPKHSAVPASAPVAGEAQHDTDSVCAWQVWWNQHKSRYTTTRQASLAAFAAGKEWRGAAPQASEAVRNALEMLTREAQAVADDHHRPRYTRLDEAIQAARAALSAQPGAQKEQP